MRKLLAGLSLLLATSGAIGAPFTARAMDEKYGVGTIAWRLASNLTRDATGSIELCYVERDAPRVLGRVGLRPFTSTEPGMPDLRILFSKADVNGSPHVVLIVGYGIRSGTFVLPVPGLTTHSLTVISQPTANERGEYTLLGFTESGNVRYENGEPAGLDGRLFFRFVPR